MQQQQKLQEKAAGASEEEGVSRPNASPVLDVEMEAKQKEALAR